MSSNIKPLVPRSLSADAARAADNGAGVLENLNRQLLESSSEGVTLSSLDGALLYMNGTGQRLLEIADLAALIGKSVVELWPEDERRKLREALAAACGGEESHLSVSCVDAAANLRWWDITVVPLTEPGGRVINILTRFRDVTTRNVLAENLQRSEEQFSAIANNMAQLAWLADPKGNVFWYNQRWRDFTGAESDDLEWQKFHHPEHIERVSEKYNRCISAGVLWEDLFPIRAANGVYRWFLSRAMPVRDCEGRVKFWCGTNTDVTDQRGQSHRLRQLARIIELAHEAILVREIGGRIVLWNRGCQELYGFTAATAIGAISFKLLKPHDVPTAEDFDRMLLADGEWSGEIRYTASDGTHVWVDSRQELIDIGGRRVILETSRDITERRQADETRTLLIGELNHRVKNTLAIVQSIAAQTARTSVAPDRFVRSFNGRLQSLAIAHNVLSDALWYGAPLEELVRSQLSVAGIEDDRVEISGEPLFVPSQTALQLTLIVHELATNAMRHGALSTSEGRIQISWHAASTEANRVSLTWRETGGPSVSAPKARGFGMTLIERSSGLPNLKARLDFEPSGIVAHIDAELHAGGVDECLFNPGKKLSRCRKADRLARGSERRRVLIIGQSYDAALYLEDLLESGGHSPIGPVATAGAAIAELDQSPIDLVVTDVDELGASEFGKLFTELSARKIPLIAVGSEKTVSALSLDPFTCVITKPIDDVALQVAIASVVGSLPAL